MWVVGWWWLANLIFFLNLLAWRTFLFGYGNYPSLTCKLITHLIIHEPPSASYLGLFLAQSLKPQRETVHLWLFLRGRFAVGASQSQRGGNKAWAAG